MANPSDSVRVVARIVARPDREDEVRSLLESLIDPTRAEPGCLRYELLQGRADTRDFTFLEEWSSEKALKAHLASEHLRRAASLLDELTIDTLEVRTYELVR